jgi:hypothetical protein
VSHEAQTVVQALLEKEPTKRMTLPSLLQHKWAENVYE